MSQVEEMNRRFVARFRPPLLRDFAKIYLSAKLKNADLRESTKKSFENQVTKHLIPGLGHLPLDLVTGEEWDAWVLRLQRANERGEKVISRFFNLRKCLTEILCAAQKDGLIKKVPKLSNPDQPQEVGRVLPDEEIHRILWQSERPFRFMFYAFWKLGCRPRETLAWEWSMLNWKDSGELWVNIPAQISKSNRARSVLVDSATMKRILLIRRKRFMKTFCLSGSHG